MDETLTTYETIGAQGRALKSTLPELIGTDNTEVFLAEQAELRRAGVPGTVLPVGATVPDTALLALDGSDTTLAAELGDGPGVLVFYRGVWCPFCNLTLHTYASDLMPALEARDVRLVAISPQAPEHATRMAEERAVAFPMLADPGNDLARRIGITMQPSAPAVERLRLLGMDMAEFNLDGSREVPYPTVVVVDAARTIRFIDVHTDYSTRTEVADVLLAVDALLLDS